MATPNLPTSIGVAAFCGALLLPQLLWAAPPPPAQPAGTVGAQAPASTGTTDIDGGGKFAAATTADPAAPVDVNELELSAGGLLSTGNARAGSVTGAAKFRVKRKSHQFSGGFAGNYGRAAADATSATKPTVSNVQGRLRYDYFLHERVSLFAMLTARHDKFQGLQARVNVDPGVAVYILTDAKNRLWAEAGYDYQFDRFLLEATYKKDDTGMVVLDNNGDPEIAIDRQRNNHAVRLFGGYTNQINSNFSFGTGVEYLQSVLVAKRYRVNWDTSITAQLINRLALSLTFTARLDNDPAPGIRKVDTITSASLIYRFF
jgi:putative salt-induced outer membrane protein